MQALIMAAGKGSRIEGKTDGLPKSYLKINGESLIERQIRLTREVGVSEIIIVTGYQKECFEKDFAADDVKFAFNPFFDTANVLSSYWCAMNFLKEDVLYMHADTIYDKAILEATVETEGDIILPVDYKACGDEEMKVRTKDGLVYEINKTMAHADAEGEFIGVAKINQSVIPAMNKEAESILAAKNFGAFVEVALQNLTDKNQAKLKAISTGGAPWNEIDFVEDYEHAVELFTK